MKLFRRLICIMTLLSVTAASYASDIFTPEVRTFELKADSGLNLNVHLKISGIHWDPQLVITLDGREICSMKPTMQGNAWTSGEPFQTWSAENPVVYGIRIYSKSLKGRKMLKSERFCFRNVQIDDYAPVVNRREVVLKAVNASGFSRSRSAERMKEELLSMKSMHINTLRTDVEEDPILYALCDSIGMYVSHKTDPDAPCWDTPEVTGGQIAERYQPIRSWTSPEDIGSGIINVFNGWDFTSLEGCTLKWEILSDGDCICSGEKDDLKAGPQSIEKIKPGFSSDDIPADKEVLLNLSYHAGDNVPAFKKDDRIAFEQIVLNRAWPHSKPVGGRIDVDQEGDGLVFYGKTSACEKWKVIFELGSGEVKSITVDGVEHLGSPIRPDFGMNIPDLKMTHFALRPGCQVVTTYFSRLTGTVRVNYYIDADGTVEITQTLEDGITLSNGISLRTAEGFRRVNYYGNGPEKLRHYTCDASEERTVSDLRWVRSAGPDGTGISVYCDSPFLAGISGNNAMRVSAADGCKVFSLRITPVL